MVRVVTVTPDWIPFWNTGAWTKAVKVKESDSLKYFEVAYWEETDSVHFYEFPNDYDPRYCSGKLTEHTEAECIAYREQYALVTTKLVSDIKLYQSYAITQAFNEFIDIIVSRYPKARHALMYSGHGGPGGKFIEGKVLPRHVQFMLRHWADKLQNKLAFIDMGGPCNKGSYGDLVSFCPFTDYYIASDLQNGGYIPTYDDNFTVEENNIESQYHQILAENDNTLEALKERIAFKQRAYDHSETSFSQLKKINDLSYQQANYLYSCANFKTLYDTVNEQNIPQSNDDLKNHITNKLSPNSNYLEQFNDVFIAQADSRKFNQWAFEANGLLCSSNQFASLKGEHEAFVQTYPELDFKNNTPLDQNTIISQHMMPDADMDGDGIINKLDKDVDGDGIDNYGDYSEIWYGSDMFIRETTLMKEVNGQWHKNHEITGSVNALLSLDKLSFNALDTHVDVNVPFSNTRIDSDNNTTIFYQDKNAIVLAINNNGTSNATYAERQIFSSDLPRGTQIKIENGRVYWKVKLTDDLVF